MSTSVFLAMTVLILRKQFPENVIQLKKIFSFYQPEAVILFTLKKKKSYYLLFYLLGLATSVAIFPWNLVFVEEIKADLKIKQKYIFEWIITDLAGKLIEMFSLSRSEFYDDPEPLGRQEQ